LAKQIPARRIGTPEDMAGAAIFLASRAGDYVVGDALAVVAARAGRQVIFRVAPHLDSRGSWSAG